MKNKFLLLGLLVAMFALAIPAFADPNPGGSVVAYGLENLSVSTVPTIGVVDIVPTVAVVASLVLVPILFSFPAVRRRVLSIPWAASFWKTLDATRLKVRRNFDKLTVSPVLKRQVA